MRSSKPTDEEASISSNKFTSSNQYYFHPSSKSNLPSFPKKLSCIILDATFPLSIDLQDAPPREDYRLTSINTPLQSTPNSTYSFYSLNSRVKEPQPYYPLTKNSQTLSEAFDTQHPLQQLPQQQQESSLLKSNFRSRFGQQAQNQSIYLDIRNLSRDEFEFKDITPLIQDSQQYITLSTSQVTR
jgi:hypothetical protein